MPLVTFQCESVYYFYNLTHAQLEKFKTYPGRIRFNTLGRDRFDYVKNIDYVVIENTETAAKLNSTLGVPDFEDSLFDDTPYVDENY